LIRRQLGDGLGDLFDFHAAQYSTGGAWLSHGRDWLSRGKGLVAGALTARFEEYDGGANHVGGENLAFGAPRHCAPRGSQ
jgi:hypothetical protein